VRACVARARIRLDRCRTEPCRVSNGCPDHRDRNASAAVAAPHRDARDDPHIEVVDARRRAGSIYSREIQTRSDRDPSDRVAFLIRDEARSPLAPRETRELGAPLWLATLVEPSGALFGGRVTREKIPAGRAPGPPRHRLHVVDTRRGERADV
jgi:hypothetical protein